MKNEKKLAAYLKSIGYIIRHNLKLNVTETDAEFYSSNL